MAENVQDNSDQLKQLAGSRPSSVTKEERENRARNVRERQHEERQRKLEEIKAQALAAQRFKEQKELERRNRIDELRTREDGRRQLVEERKRAINEAERDRLESILKRNQEREARIEAKKRNERSSMVFAFGSSTPRMLDDIGPYCGPRRATSTQNIMSASVIVSAAGIVSYGNGNGNGSGAADAPGALTRRQSERELDATGKKRATSAGGLERNPDGTTDQAVTTPAGCISGHVGRRRTDLVPTIPLKDTSLLAQQQQQQTGGSTSPSSRTGTKARSSPGRAYSMSRLDQLATPRKRHPVLNVQPALVPLSPASQHTLRYVTSNSGGGGSDMSRSMSHLAAAGGGKAGSGGGGAHARPPLRKVDSRSMHHLSVAGAAAVAPLPPPRMTRATQLRHQKQMNGSVAVPAPAQNEAPSRPGSAMSQQSTTSVASSTMGPVHMRTRPITAPARKARPISIAVTGISSGPLPDKSSPVLNNHNNNNNNKPPLPKTRRHASAVNRSQDRIKKAKTAAALVPSPTEPTKAPATAELVPMLAACDMDPAARGSASAEGSGGVREEAEDVNKGEAATEMLLDLDATPLAAPQTTTTTTAPAAVVAAPTDHETTIAADSVPPTSTEEHLSTPAPQPQPPEHHHTTAAIVMDGGDVSDPVIPKSTELSVTVADDLLVHVGDVADEPLRDAEGNVADLLGGDLDGLVDMSASMSKVRITTEEEAKAALAEKRRVAREEAERQAELERQRREEEIRAEQERQHREEEQQRVLIEEMMATEQKRLEEAIKQKQFEEEEERQRAVEESRQKQLKEEAERRAKEEAERLKVELEERMRNEEKEREARRKRVEAIMLRTRGKNTNASPPQSEDKSEKINGSNSDVAENGHKNGKNLETVDNIIPVETLKNANIIDSLSSDDTLNSNNAWQINTPTDLLM